MFEIQGTARRAPLSSLLYNISSWIGSGQLQLMINNTQVTGQDVEDFNRSQIYLPLDLRFFSFLFDG